MPLSDLDTLFDANTSQAKAITAVYQLLQAGVPNIAGYTSLINTNLSTNFGSGTSTVFNDENIYINVANALVQGNTAAATAFATLAPGASLVDQVTALYQSLIPAQSQTAAGLAFMTRPDALAFYQASAAERGITSNNGGAIIAFASILKVAVDQDIGGIGDSVNDFLAAVDDGSAAVPETGTVFTDIETADGTAYDTDDSTPGGTAVLTIGADTVTANTFEAPLGITILGALVPTLNTVDNLTGIGTNPTVNATLAAVATNPTLNGIETVNVQQTAASILNLSKAPNLAALNYDGGLAGVATTFTATNIQTNVANTLGASNLVNGAGDAVMFQHADSVVASAADAVTVNISSFGLNVLAAGDLNVRGTTDGGFETVTLNATGQNSFASVLSEVAGVNVAVSAANDIRTLNITGDGTVRIAAANTNVTTIDASANTGGVRVASDPLAVVAFTGGTGDDRLTAVAGLTNADVSDGGAGTGDELVVSNATGVGAGNGVTNFEILDFAGAGAAIAFDGDNVAGLTDVQVNDGAGAFGYTITDLAAGTTTVSLQTDAGAGLGGVVLGVKGDTAAGAINDSLTVNLNVAAGTAGAAGIVTGGIAAAGIENMTLNVGSAAFLTTGAVAGATMNNIIITGGGAGAALTITGVAGVAVTGAQLIDGSAFTGVLTVAGGVFGNVIRGGSGADALSTGGSLALAAGTQANVLTGNGGADDFNFAASDTAAAGAAAAITAIEAAGTGLVDINRITDLNLGSGTAGGIVDQISVAGTGGAMVGDATVTVVNGGAATAMTGINLGAAIAGVVEAGGVLNLGVVTVGTTTAGLFTFGGNTFFIASAQDVTADVLGAVGGSDIIINVTGVTGTFDASDIIV